MKRLKNSLSYSSTKQGVASLCVVIFATILFGVITLSFIRIILSEASQSSNDDLSRSAYDSALAGVEDAKIAVNKYYECMSKPGATKGSCKYTELFATSGDASCEHFGLMQYLYKDLDAQGATEVKVQESQSNNSDQAYTCVILRDEVEDYRTTLSSDARSKVIPLGVNNDKLSEIAQIEISWYSENNGTVFKENYKTHGGKLAPANDATIPPAVTATLIRTEPSINLNDYNNSTDGDHYSSMFFLPTDKDNSEGINEINNETIKRAGNSKFTNSPFQIKCEHRDFACTVRLTGLNGSFHDGGSAFLVLSLPYGETNTDFRVTLRNKDDVEIKFKGVQISVDSTGRANQLYRRVETRLDPVDTFFPYPEYELDLGGEAGKDALSKSFWITTNCWTENGYCSGNNGQI